MRPESSPGRAGAGLFRAVASLVLAVAACAASVPARSAEHPDAIEASLEAAPGDRRIAVSWIVRNIAKPWGYNVYRFDGEASAVPVRLNPLPLPGGSRGSLLDDDLRNGTPYHYRVTVIDGGGTERWLPGGVWMKPAALPGDVDGEADGDGLRRVDGLDLVRIMAAFGASRGAPAFDESSDLNGDGTVDGRDVEILSGNMGRKGHR